MKQKTYSNYGVGFLLLGILKMVYDWFWDIGGKTKDGHDYAPNWITSKSLKHLYLQQRKLKSQ